MDRRSAQLNHFRGVTSFVLGFVFMLSSALGAFTAPANGERESQIETQSTSFVSASLTGESDEHHPPATSLGNNGWRGDAQASTEARCARFHLEVKAREVLSFAPKNSPPGRSA